MPLLIVPSQALYPVAAAVITATPDETDGGSEGLSLGKGRLEREEESFSIEMSLGSGDDWASETRARAQKNSGRVRVDLSRDVR